MYSEMNELVDRMFNVYAFTYWIYSEMNELVDRMYNVYAFTYLMHINPRRHTFKPSQESIGKSRACRT
jgi:hypothetical protein